MGGRGAGGHDVGAHTVDLEGGADFGNLVESLIGQFDLVEQVLGGADALGEFAFGLGILCGESVGIVFVGDAALDDLDAQSGVARCGDFDGEAETVEQLRSEFALFGVHRAHEDEACGVNNRHAVAFDSRTAHRGRVEQQVDQVVVQQVDLVDIQDAAVGAGEQAGLIFGDAFGEGPFEVKRAEDAVFGGAHGEFDEPDGPGFDGGIGFERAVGGEWVAFARVTGETVAGDDVDRRQNVGQRAHHGGFGGAFFAPHEYAADRRRDRGQRKGERHVVGSDDGAEWEVMWHLGLPLFVP